MPCIHDKLSATVVFVPAMGRELRRAVITANCAECGLDFEFIGAPEGVGQWEPGVSADRKQLWVPIAEKRK